jgi:hypothetical protein
MDVAKFKPLLDSAFARYEKFNKPTPEDVERIFGPVFDTIALTAETSREEARALLRDTVAAGPIVRSVLDAMAAVASTPPADAEKLTILELDENGHDDATGPVAGMRRTRLEETIKDIRRGRTERAVNRGLDAQAEWYRREAILSPE